MTTRAVCARALLCTGLLWTAIPESKLPQALFRGTKMNDPPPRPGEEVKRTKIPTKIKQHLASVHQQGTQE